MVKDVPEILVGIELPETGFALHQQKGRDGEGPAISFEEAKRSVDYLLDNGLGNFIAVRAYRLQPGPQNYFTQMKMPLPVDSDGFRIIEYAIRRGLHVTTIYTCFSAEAARRLQAPDVERFFHPNLGERTNPAPAILAWYKKRPVPPTRREAKEEAVRYLRDECDHHGRPGVAHYLEQGFKRVAAIVISPLDARYVLDSGVNVLMAETMCYSVDNQLSGLRGAARAKNLPAPLGVWIANGWFGPSNCRPEKADVFRLALYHAWLYGCGRFILETPALGSIEYGEFTRDANDPLARKHVEILKSFYEFAREQPRPRGFPEVSIGLLRGQFDNYQVGARPAPQFANPQWPAGDAEANWRHIRLFFPQQTDPPAEDEHFWFSGTPFGPVDLVPVEAKPAHLRKYSLLALLGHHTMDDAMYAQLRRYVEEGGTLLMGGAHLRTEDETWYNHGDWTDFAGAACAPAQERSLQLEPAAYISAVTIVDEGGIGLPVGQTFTCPRNYHVGCRVSVAPDVRVLARSEKGVPVMILRQLGRGRLFFMPLLTWPAHHHYADLYRCVLERLAFLARPSFRLEGHRTTNYAAGGGKPQRLLAALNTSRQNTDRFTVVVDDNWSHGMTLQPGEFMRLFRSGAFMIRPADTSVRILEMAGNERTCSVTLAGHGYHLLSVILPPTAALAKFALENGRASWRPMAWNWGLLGLELKGRHHLTLSCHHPKADWAPAPEQLSNEILSAANREQ